MTPAEQCDENAAKLLRCYQGLGEVALVIRTQGAEVATIMPNGDRAFIAKLLRKAADTIETTKDQA